MATPVPFSMDSASHRTLYRGLLRHALVRLTVLYFIPLLLLTLFFHLQYRMVAGESDERHRRSLAFHQAALLEFYLGDRLLNLTDLTDDPDALVAPNHKDLQSHLTSLQSISEAFVDLSVLDETGRVLAYVGPHTYLAARDYSHEAWFVKLLTGPSSHVVTDVHLGFRDDPHFTMALKLEPQGKTRILRTVLQQEIALAQIQTRNTEPLEPGGTWLASIATNIWLFTGLFCLIGGLIIWLQARWVARQQYEARLKERRLSQQLGQAAKLALVGELAAGIAHEINNPLAIVAEKAGLMKDLLDPRFGQETSREKLQAQLDSIENAVFRCSGITRQLLGFVRQHDVELKTFDLHELLDNLVTVFLGPELEVADISVGKNYDSDIPVIHSDPDQLRQVVLNLLKNGADSISGPGRLTLTTRRSGDHFSLSVADTGHGLEEHELEQVFMPFYTTKDPGRGTGLGLSVSYGIIEGLGGHLSVRSQIGHGSVFTIDLPLWS